MLFTMEYVNLLLIFLRAIFFEMTVVLLFWYTTEKAFSAQRSSAYFKKAEKKFFLASVKPTLTCEVALMRTYIVFW